MAKAATYRLGVHVEVGLVVLQLPETGAFRSVRYVACDIPIICVRLASSMVGEEWYAPRDALLP